MLCVISPCHCSLSIPKIQLIPNDQILFSPFASTISTFHGSYYFIFS